MQVDFYHLTARPLDRVLPRIAEKVVDNGGRLVIVAGDEAQREMLDKLLWRYAADSFLPHGLAGTANDAAQPVLISAEPVAGNGARNIAIADSVWRDAALAFDRAFHFFDDDAIVEARAAWRALADKPDVERRYWKQGETGGWEQAA
ncbi:DNA polymerase III subunit chi [Sphingomonas sp. 28-63-12]|uniref:DNA polymerase III subunit chi n=1 Tax=Sphingomonas sp. 28-63-12 TaxID=1970434 RepID=UPI000BD7AAB7|nr:MAG: DNA polymerase III subunit chi [Sphingomonas sp. 28-63-12]